MPPISAFAQVQARPLFSQTRRPGAPAGSLPASASFTLMAIVISAEDRHALLASGQPPKVVRVNEGEELGGWTVETILPNAVIVRRADLREEVKAKEAKKSTAEKPVSAVSAVTSAMHDTAQPRKSHDE
jgi:general secretion pathway protein N